MCERELERLALVREAVRKLVVWSLAGDLEAVEAARLYFAGLSPSEIVHELGAPRTRKIALRGKIQRLGTGPVAATAVAVFRRPVDPVVVKTGGGYICLLCGRAVGGRPVSHVARNHSDVVEKLVGEVLEEVLRG
ncbi:MAG: hypothetical protein QW753_04890 [Thermofilum sp.]